MTRAVTSILLFALAAALSTAAGGCVRRTMRITSDPSGALVYLNDREVGRTPVDVDFVHYGTYDVRLVREGSEALLTFGRAEPPLWDVVGLDFLAEVLPVKLESRIEWHYVLEPAIADTEEAAAALVERARATRRLLTGGGDGAVPAGGG